MPDVSSLYIHVPFCRQKCNYCDFISLAGKEDLIDQYVDSLIREISEKLTKETQLKTIYFGGGTPTLLSPQHFSRILETVSWTPSSEITVEANPGTASLEKLKILRDLGINRLSLGVQSFNDTHLKTLGRIHDSNQALKFYRDARTAGFENINLDLIFALPNQTLAEWQADLQQAIGLRPTHLSTYNLIIEENTPLHSQIRTPTSQLSPPSEDEEAEMYEYAIDTFLQAGYKQYEISNFAQPNFECRHNINYWQMGNWQGVGVGAHSHVDGKIWAGTSSLEEYCQQERELITRNTISAGEVIMMGLRLLMGIPATKFCGFEKEVSGLIEEGLMEAHENNYRLTNRGLFLGNQVFAHFV